MRLSEVIFGVIGLVITVLTIFYLLWNLDWNATYTLFMKAEFAWLALALFFFIANYALRTIRFKLLYNNNELSMRQLAHVTFMYGMFNYILPAKTGEIFYVLIASSQLKVRLVHGTSVILAARLYDIIALILFVAVVIIFGSNELPVWIYNLLLILEIFALLALIVLVAWVRHDYQSSRSRPDTKPRRMLRELLTAFHSLHNWPDMIMPVMLAVGIWLCIYANFYCIVKGLGFDADIYQLILISIVLIPLTLLPQGIANLGTHEIAWIAVFQMFGFQHQDALQIAFGSHVILTVCVIVLGLAGLMLYRKSVA